MGMGLLGKKVGMTQLHTASGVSVPVTLIEAGPCPIVQKKVKVKEGYDAVQVGFDPCKEKRHNRAVLGHYKKAGVKACRLLGEFRVEDPAAYEVGQEVNVEIFQEGERVDVIGISKGKGFAGVVKRWGFAGGPASHGTHKWHRRVGSIGASSDPSRVFKGTKMPGRLGGKRATSENLTVVSVDSENGILAVRGAVPGARGGYVVVCKAKKKTRERTDAGSAEAKPKE